MTAVLNEVEYVFKGLQLCQRDLFMDACVLTPFLIKHGDTPSAGWMVA